MECMLIRCFSCGESYEVDDSLAGRKVQCGNCQTKLYLEAGADGITVRACMACPACGQEHFTDPRRLGATGQCRKCGASYQYAASGQSHR